DEDVVAYHSMLRVQRLGAAGRVGAADPPDDLVTAAVPGSSEGRRAPQTGAGITGIATKSLCPTTALASIRLDRSVRTSRSTSHGSNAWRIPNSSIWSARDDGEDRTSVTELSMVGRFRGGGARRGGRWPHRRSVHEGLPWF